MYSYRWIRICIYLCVYSCLCCFVCNFVGILCYSFYFHNHVLLGVPFNCPRYTYVRQSPRNAIVVSPLPRLSDLSHAQIVQLECALYRFLYRSQSTTAPTTSLTSINNFLFREESVSCSLPHLSLSLCMSLYKFTWSLWFLFLIFGYIWIANIKANHQSITSALPLSSLPLLTRS